MKILEVENVSFYYKKNFKRVPILSNISFSLEDNEILAICGKSGIGKTTIARSIVGLNKLYDGKITLNIDKKDIQYIFQDPFSSLNPYATVLEIISEGMHFDSYEEKVNMVLDMMKQVGLDENKLHYFPSSFSGGERQKIAIARAFIHNPKLVIADEITSSIDYHSKIAVISLLKKFHTSNHCAFIIISHNNDFINKLTDRILFLK